MFHASPLRDTRAGPRKVVSVRLTDGIVAPRKPAELRNRPRLKSIAPRPVHPATHACPPNVVPTNEAPALKLDSPNQVSPWKVAKSARTCPRNSELSSHMW